jgi:hypothetical protein
MWCVVVTAIASASASAIAIKEGSKEIKQKKKEFGVCVRNINQRYAKEATVNTQYAL